MTVGAQVKGCFSSIKSVEGTLMTLAGKTQNEQARQTYKEVQEIITTIKDDLEKQVIYLAQEEPQYKE